MGLPEADSTRLIEDLMAHATQRQFVYSIAGGWMTW